MKTKATLYKVATEQIIIDSASRSYIYPQQYTSKVLNPDGSPINELGEIGIGFLNEEVPIYKIVNFLGSPEPGYPPVEDEHYAVRYVCKTKELDEVLGLRNAEIEWSSELENNLDAVNGLLDTLIERVNTTNSKPWYSKIWMILRGIEL